MRIGGLSWTTERVGVLLPGPNTLPEGGIETVWLDARGHYGFTAVGRTGPSITTDQTADEGTPAFPPKRAGRGETTSATEKCPWRSKRPVCAVRRFACRGGSLDHDGDADREPGADIGILDLGALADLRASRRLRNRLVANLRGALAMRVEVLHRRSQLDPNGL